MKHFALILELAKHRNMRVAAEQLNMTQPAASKLLQDAEAALGARLFDRSRTGVVPTPSGEVMVFRARQMQAELAAAREDMRLVSLGRHGRLRVGSFLVAAPTVLPRAVDAFLAVYPRANVTLTEGARDGLIPALAAGELDVVVGRLSEDERPPEIASHVLYQEEVCIVCGPEHPLARRKRIPARALADSNWVLAPHATVLRRRLGALFAAEGLPAPEIQVESGALLATLALIRARPMLSVLPAAVARRFVRSREIVILDVDMPRYVLPVGYYLRRATTPSPLAKAFIDCLREAAKSQS